MSINRETVNNYVNLYKDDPKKLSGLFHNDLQVQQNGVIYLERDKHYYSVPYVLIDKTARVIYTRTLVKIFVDGTQVATHPHIHGFGYTRQDNHLASNPKAVLDRSPAYYQQKAGKSTLSRVPL